MRPGLRSSTPGSSVGIALPAMRRQAGARILARLEYLSSYAQTGIAAVSCGGECRCSPIVINAHNPAERVSVPVTRELLLDPRSTKRVRSNSDSLHNCRLHVALLNSSTSGGHMFKLTGLRVGYLWNTSSYGASEPILNGTGAARRATAGLRQRSRLRRSLAKFCKHPTTSDSSAHQTRRSRSSSRSSSPSA
jgi:hypothetical protein